MGARVGVGPSWDVQLPPGQMAHDEAVAAADPTWQRPHPPEEAVADPTWRRAACWDQAPQSPLDGPTTWPALVAWTWSPLSKYAAKQAAGQAYLAGCVVLKKHKRGEI